MTRTAKGESAAIEYELNRKRVKNINLRLRKDGTVAVSAPYAISAAFIDAFVLKNAAFIERARKKLDSKAPELKTDISKSERAELLETMTRLCFELYTSFNDVKSPFPQIKVRAMKTRWGSMAVKKRVATFSTALYGKDERLLRYVAAHELCHLVVPNHSKEFWRRLSQVIPDAQKLRRELNGK